MSICSIISLICLWYFVGVVVTSYVDDTEHTPLGWASMLPDWIPVWLYAFIWPIVLILSFVRSDD